MLQSLLISENKYILLSWTDLTSHDFYFYKINIVAAQSEISFEGSKRKIDSSFKEQKNNSCSN